jgi:glycosyltransferase involved in cell wall biosynthesis
MQPWSAYPEVLASSDISMINLHPELRTPVVPSKLLSIMAAGRTVAASLPPDSDARQIIDNAKCGLYVDAGNGMALAEVIKKLKLNRILAEEMGKRGRAYAEKHFAREICIDKVEKIMIDILGGN